VIMWFAVLLIQLFQPPYPIDLPTTILDGPSGVCLLHDFLFCLPQKDSPSVPNCASFFVPSHSAFSC